MGGGQTRWTAAVSYTHLDVYKRQLSECSESAVLYLQLVNQRTLMDNKIQELKFNSF